MGKYVLQCVMVPVFKDKKIKLEKIVLPFQSHFKEGFAKMIHEVYYCCLEFDADCLKI